MPAVGVYPYSSTLWEILVETCYVLTNRNVLGELLAEPLCQIQSDYKGGLNRFICRERYRLWVETVRQHVGAIDLPDWDTIADSDEWPFEIMEAVDSDGEYEWEVFFDDGAAVNEAISGMSLDEDVDGFIERLQKLSTPDAFILVCCPHFGCFYVIQSKYVEPRGPCGWRSNQGFHVFDDIADGEDYGPIETYVLPEEMHKEWKRAEDELDSNRGLGDLRSANL